MIGQPPPGVTITCEPEADRRARLLAMMRAPVTVTDGTPPLRKALAAERGRGQADNDEGTDEVARLRVEVLQLRQRLGDLEGCPRATGVSIRAELLDALLTWACDRGLVAEVEG